MRHIPDSQRRARLLHRHALAEPVTTVEEAVRSVVCLHATEPASVYLAAAVRVGAGREQVAAALYEDRTVHRQLAMRRTMFAFPRDLLPAVWGSASRRVAAQQVARVGKDVEEQGIAADGAAWLETVCAAVVSSLAREGPATTGGLRARIPALDARLEAWRGTTTPLAGRVLTVLGAQGRIVRGRNELGWRQARHEWWLAEQWLDDVPEPLDEAAGYRELVGRWLARFGPGTDADLVWWLGATKAAVRRALAELEAVQVALDSGQSGWVLPGDVEPLPEPGGSAALLPVLDPTLMGWRRRDFYLDPADVPALFDRNGNGGTTAWWEGRVVGCWVQDPDGAVRVDLLHDVGAEGRAALDARAAWLTGWLRGDVVGTVYPSPAMRAARA